MDRISWGHVHIVQLYVCSRSDTGPDVATPRLLFTDWSYRFGMLIDPSHTFSKLEQSDVTHLCPSERTIVICCARQMHIYMHGTCSSFCFCLVVIFDLKSLEVVIGRGLYCCYSIRYFFGSTSHSVSEPICMIGRNMHFTCTVSYNFFLHYPYPFLAVMFSVLNLHICSISSFFLF